MEQGKEMGLGQEMKVQEVNVKEVTGFFMDVFPNRPSAFGKSIPLSD